MNITGILWSIAIMLVLYVVYQKLYSNSAKRGTVWVNIWELQNDLMVCLTPLRPVKAHIFKKGMVEMLRLPKKYCKKDIEGINNKHYIRSVNGHRVINLIKTGEDEFELGMPKYDQETKHIHTSFEVIDRDVSFWADVARRENAVRHNTDSFWNKIAPLVMMGVIFIFGIILFSISMSGAEDIADAIAGQSRETAKMSERLLDFMKTQAGAKNNIVQPVEQAEVIGQGSIPAEASP